MTDTNETRGPQQLLVELAERHMRTHASPLPKHPAALGWQATAGSMAAGFARALHALMETNPGKATEIAEWFDGPFGEGPDSLEHTDWTERHIAKSPKVLEQWFRDARYEASLALESTEAWEKTEKEQQVQMDAIHAYFGLSYANYLVLPRTLLQSMPDEWQTKFVTLLREYDEAFDHVPQAEVYDVTAGTEHLLDEMTPSQLAAAGITVTGDDELGHGPDTRYSKDGEELDGQSYGFVPGEDPVPHYNRGRTRVEPKLGDER